MVLIWKFSEHVGWLILFSAPILALAFIYIYRKLLAQTPTAQSELPIE
jgi:hypothetical protein